MGDNIQVHRSYYEFPENTIQLERMSKVLHAVNEGKAAPVSVCSSRKEEVDEIKSQIYDRISATMCFTDYSKAFDCVDHPTLWNMMEEMGIPVHK